MSRYRRPYIRLRAEQMQADIDGLGGQAQAIGNAAPLIESAQLKAEFHTRVWYAVWNPYRDLAIARCRS